MVIRKSVDKNLVNYQDKKKKGNFTQAKQDYKLGSRFSRKLWELSHLLKVEGTVIYIFETKDHTSKWHTVILYKVHQGYIVQVNAQKVKGNTPFFYEVALVASKERKNSIYGWAGTPILEELFLMCNAAH